MKKDLRVIKTDRNIKNSFIKLLQNKSFEAVTVQDILDEAMINRTTFYNHFSSKYDLAENLASEMLGKFDQALNIRFDSPDINNDIFEKINKIGKILSENHHVILAMWDVYTETVHLYEDMISLLRSRVQTILNASASEFQLELAVSNLMTMLRRILTDKDADAINLHLEVISFFETYLLPKACGRYFANGK
ncbi:MAG: TetR/AcrR family transcriptional regulator [Lachnospiraceae bacterium]|nr:TetR/AcrR family transcriptional regulator [Lachnospiraceae bacterium]